MYERISHFAKLLLMYQALVCLLLPGKLRAMEWNDPCEEEVQQYCSWGQERIPCLIEHRGEISGACLDRMQDYLDQHPELDERPNTPDQNSYWNNSTPHEETGWFHLW